MSRDPLLRTCGPAACALTLTAALTVLPAFAQLAVEEEAPMEAEAPAARAGLGAPGMAFGADPNVLGMSTEFLREREVVGEEGEEIGEVEEILRSAKPFAVISIEEDWGKAPESIVVPVDQLIVGPAGLLLPALSEASVGRFDAYSDGPGYTPIGAEAGTVGELFSGGGDEGVDEAEAEDEGAGAVAGLSYQGMDGMIGRDPATFAVELDTLRGTPVLDATGARAGTLDDFVRSSRIYLAVEIDNGWFEEDTQIIVPLDRLAIVGEEGDLMLRGVTAETIEEYEAFAEQEGGYVFGGYEGLGQEYLAVGEAYEELE